VRASTEGGYNPGMSPGVPLTEVELFREAARRSEAREPFVLCAVTATARSAPRDAGAKMLVAPDGSIAGTVGGGPLEAMVIEEAKRLLRGEGTSCERRFALTAAGDAAAPLPAGADECDELGMKCGGEVTVFLDVVRPSPRLLLYGAGHVGERVAAIAIAAGLATTVVDDRPEFAARDRFPGAADVRCADLTADPLGGLSPGAADFVVVLTRCHALDESVTEAMLKTQARYIGLIGSRRKVALILRSIGRRLGRDPREDPRVHAPVGLRLGNKTPGEIAISILAEVLLIKSRGQLSHSRLTAQGPARVAR
jgi:xanthine dehydrogenase accessory factor